MIVIVFGLPGSGKSFFASRLANLIDAVYIKSDQVRIEMHQQKTYSTEEKLTVYDEMLTRMNKNVKENRNVVLDATFYKYEIRKKFIDAAVEGISFVEIVADEQVIKERMKEKRPDSDADFEVYKKIKSEWEALIEDHLTLQSTNNNIDEMLRAVATYLNVKK